MLYINRKELCRQQHLGGFGGSEKFVAVYVERFEHNRRKRFPTEEEAIAWAKEQIPALDAMAEPYSIRVVDNVTGMTLFQHTGAAQKVDMPVAPAGGEEEGLVYVVHIEPEGEIPATSAFTSRNIAISVAEEAAQLMEKENIPCAVRVTIGPFGACVWEK